MNSDPIDRESKEWRPLSRFFTSYLSQDFVDDYGDPWTAVAAFAAESTAPSVADAARAARLLAVAFDEDDITERAADRLGLAYSPRADGLSCKAWLLAVADHLETSDRPGD